MLRYQVLDHTSALGLQQTRVSVILNYARMNEPCANSCENILRNIRKREIGYRRLADGPVALNGDGYGHEDGGGEGDAGHWVEESEDHLKFFNVQCTSKEISF